MDTKFILNFLILIATVELHQVYEIVDEPISAPKYDTVRIARNLNRTQRGNFTGVTQIDQRRWRYIQQQQSDAQNVVKNKFLMRQAKVLAPRTPILQKREITVQDQNLLYLPPPKYHMLGLNKNVQLLHESFGKTQQEQQLQALNSLLGKSPNAQLQGLQQLLTSKDHTPIDEDMMDVANPQSQPNIKVDALHPELQKAVAQAQAYEANLHNKYKEQNLFTLAHIESELNAAAQVQAKEALAKAQQAALREVQAQHQVIAEAQKSLYQQAHAQMQIAQHPIYTNVVSYQAAPKPNPGPPKIYQNLVSYKPTVVQPKPIDEPKRNPSENKNNLQYASQYAFGYRVRDHKSINDFGHEEMNDGKTTKGHYHVLLPDGRLQNVEYWADETGFHAKNANCLTLHIILEFQDENYLTPKKLLS